MMHYFARSCSPLRFRLGWLAALLFLCWGQPLTAQPTQWIEVQEQTPIRFTLQGDSYHATIHVQPGPDLKDQSTFVVMMAEKDNSRASAIDLGKGKVLTSDPGFKAIPLAFPKDTPLPKTPHLFLRSDPPTWNDTLPLAMTLPAVSPVAKITLKIQSVNDQPVTDGTVRLSTPPDTVTLEVLITWDGLPETLKAIVELQGATGKPLNSKEPLLQASHGETTVKLFSEKRPNEASGRAILKARIASVGKPDGTLWSQRISLPDETVTLIFSAEKGFWEHWWLWVAAWLWLLAGVGIWQRRQVIQVWENQVVGVRCPKCQRIYRGWNLPTACGKTSAHQNSETVPLFGIQVHPDSLKWGKNQRVKETVVLSNPSVRPIQVSVKSHVPHLHIVPQKGHPSQSVTMWLGVAQNCELQVEGNLGGIQNRQRVITVEIVRPRVRVEPIRIAVAPSGETATPLSQASVSTFRSDTDLIIPEIELKGEVPTPFRITNQNKQEGITVQLTNQPKWVEVSELPLELKPGETRECVVWATEKANQRRDGKLSWQVNGKVSKSTQVTYIPEPLFICDVCNTSYFDLTTIPVQCPQCKKKLLSVQLEPSAIAFTAESGFAPQTISLVNESVVPVELRLHLDQVSPWLDVGDVLIDKPFQLAKGEKRDIVVRVNDANADVSAVLLSRYLTVSDKSKRLPDQSVTIQYQPQKRMAPAPMASEQELIIPSEIELKKVPPMPTEINQSSVVRALEVTPSSVKLSWGSDLPTKVKIQNKNKQVVTVKVEKPEWLEVGGLIDGKVDLQPDESREYAVWVNTKGESLKEVLQGKIRWKIVKPSEGLSAVQDLRYTPRGVTCPKCRKFYPHGAIPKECECQHVFIQVNIEPLQVDFSIENGYSPKRLSIKTAFSSYVMAIKVEVSEKQKGIEIYGLPVELWVGEEKEIAVWCAPAKVGEASGLFETVVILHVSGNDSKGFDLPPIHVSYRFPAPISLSLIQWMAGAISAANKLLATAITEILNNLGKIQLPSAPFTPEYVNVVSRLGECRNEMEGIKSKAEMEGIKSKAEIEAELRSWRQKFQSLRQELEEQAKMAIAPEWLKQFEKELTTIWKVIERQLLTLSSLPTFGDEKNMLTTLEEDGKRLLAAVDGLKKLQTSQAPPFPDILTILGGKIKITPRPWPDLEVQREALPLDLQKVEELDPPLQQVAHVPLKE